MRRNKEQVLEVYMWDKMKNGEKVPTSDCFRKIEQKFRIKIRRSCTKEQLNKLILRVRNRLKKRKYFYLKNLEMLQSKANCPLDLLLKWENAGRIDLANKNECSNIARVFIERDFVLTNGLSGDQIPIDPNLPIDHFYRTVGTSKD